eukprot:Colp12_sorted_trinity150504_noHs@19574
MADHELFELRANFYLGNYQAVVSEAQKLQPSTPEGKEEKDAFLYRAYLAQGKYSVVLNEIHPEKSATSLQAIRVLAAYLQPNSDKSAAKDKLQAFQSDVLKANDPIVQLVTAIIHIHEQNLEEAVRTLHNSDDLECISLLIQCFLMMNRVDLAAKELREHMATKDDDATITQLTTAWVNLALGGEKYQDAFYTFQELGEKHNGSAKLLVSQAVCQAHQARWEEAESLLQEAYEKNAQDADTLANLTVATQHEGKPQETVNRFLTQLRDAAPNHPLLKDLAAKEAAFDRAAQQYAISA